jgi:murein DD-endopeptidase MepM/ murein hydrolase activator NlpD
VLDLGHGEFALLAHLRRGSVRVRTGQRVRAGTLLGLCGNSGNTSEPHLHFHVQDRAKLFGAARGLPATFVDYRADGRRIARGTPRQGEFVRR